MNSDILGVNLFAYCSNNPVNRTDDQGTFWDTFFDVASTAYSAWQVIKNPKDPANWAALAADVVCLAIPGVTGGGTIIRGAKYADEAVSAAKGADRISDAADAVYDSGKIVEELHRPYIRKSVRETVEANALRAPDGRFLDANTRIPIDGKYDLGHVRGHEFWREKENAMAKGWSQKVFNDYMNNPSFYQIESPAINRSHKFELPK